MILGSQDNWPQFYFWMDQRPPVINDNYEDILILGGNEDGERMKISKKSRHRSGVAMMEYFVR